MLLSLPCFAPSIPTTIELAPCGVKMLRMALALSKLGAITDADLAHLSETTVSAEAVRTVVQRGWKNLLGDRFEFRVLAATCSLTIGDSMTFGAMTDDSDEIQPTLSIGAGYPEWISCGDTLEAVDDLEPGMGRFILDQLDRVLFLFGHPHTPSNYLDMASYEWWMGEEDESVVLAEMASDGVDPDDLDVVRREDLFMDVPEWAYATLPASTLELHQNPAALAAAIERLHGTRFAALADAVAELAALPTDEDAFLRRLIDEYGEETNVLCPPVVLQWRIDGQFNALIDDHMRHFQECDGGTDIAMWDAVPPTVEGIQEALGRISHTGDTLQALDRLLSLLSPQEVSQ